MGEIIQEENLNEDHIGYAEDTPLDYSLIESDSNNLQYLKSLLKNSKDFYVALRSKVFDKVIIDRVETVYQYDHENNEFKVSELELNQEEDYIILALEDVYMENIPIFKITTTIVETGFFESLYINYFKLPFYEWRYKKENGKENVA